MKQEQRELRINLTTYFNSLIGVAEYWARCKKLSEAMRRDIQAQGYGALTFAQAFCGLDDNIAQELYVNFNNQLNTIN